MNLVGTSLFSGLAVLTKLATSLVLNKVLATYVGPTGYAVIGQFQNLISLIGTFAGGAINNGVVKFTAEHAGDLPHQRAIWRTAVTSSLMVAALCSVGLIAFSGPLARWSFGDTAFDTVFLWLAAALPLLVLNGILLAILNGRKTVRAFVVCNIAGSIVSAITATTLVLLAGLYGALTALAISQAVACVITAWILFKTVPLRLRDVIGRVDPSIARGLAGFALMAATSALVAPLTQILIRDQLASSFSWNVAGLWQALTKISELHLLLLTTTLSIYFLPRLAEIKDAEQLQREVSKGMRFVVPLVMTSALCIYMLRQHLVAGLLTREFLPLSEAMGLQLVGDVLKMGSWVLAFTMISHSRTRLFIVTEIIFGGLLAGLSIGLSKPWGLMGTAAGYALTYLIYWITMQIYYRKLVSELRVNAVRK